MKKKKKGRKLSRKSNQRKALLRSLARSLFLNNRIKTTEAKAKELSPFVEKIITRAKKDDLATRRYLSKFFASEVAGKLIKEIGPIYRKRKGGYTRIIKLGPRKGDGAKMALIELIK